MKSLLWKNLVGQDRVRAVLGAAFEGDTLGHAYLLCGDEGYGTFAAAMDLAMAMQCTGAGAVPCGMCEPCKKMARNAYPDFRCIFPVALQKEHKTSDGTLSAEGWTYLTELARKKISSPYLPLDFDGLPDIPIEWMREFVDTIQRGAVETKSVVAILCGVDTLSSMTANTLLKTLEEPPPNTCIILCTDRPQAVLPTIVSRCQIVRFGALKDDDIRNYLRARYDSGVPDEKMETVISHAQGSLGAALELIENPPDKVLELAMVLRQMTEEPDWLKRAERIDEIASLKDYGLYEKMFLYCLFDIRTLFFQTVSGSTTYFTATAAHAGPDAVGVGQAIAACENALAGIRARGNISLVVITFIMALTEILHGEKQ